jgi:hypothetical protein
MAGAGGLEVAADDSQAAADPAGRGAAAPGACCVLERTEHPVGLQVSHVRQLARRLAGVVSPRQHAAQADRRPEAPDPSFDG